MFTSHRQLKIRLLFIRCFTLTFVVLLVFSPALAQPTSFSARGVGGGGALFLPSFNGLHKGELNVACDMSQLFTSTNYGKSWSQTHFSELQVGNNHGLVQSVFGSQTKYAIDATSKNGVEQYRPTYTSDGGKTWTPFKNDPTSGTCQYLFASNRSGVLVAADYLSLYISNDRGISWTTIFTSKNNSSGIHVAGVFFFPAGGFESYCVIGTNEGVFTNYFSKVDYQRVNLTGIPADESIVSFSATIDNALNLRFYAVTLGIGDVYSGVTAIDNQNFKGIYVADAVTYSWAKKVTGLPPSAKPFFISCVRPPGDRNQPDICYTAGGSGSAPIVYKSSDYGSTWTSVFNSLNNKNITTGWSGDGGDREWSYGEYAMGFAVRENDPSTLCFTDFGFVHISTDGGNSWTQTYLDSATANPAGAVIPKGKSYKSVGLENTTCWQVEWIDDKTLWACFSDIKGCRSTDAGATWSFNYTGHSDNSSYRIAMNSSTPSPTLYLATSTVHDMYQSTYLQDSRIDNGKGKVLISRDKGATWTLSKDFAHPVVWVEIGGQDLYASVVHSTQGGVFKASIGVDGTPGVWTQLPKPPSTEGHPFCLKWVEGKGLLASYCGRRDAAGKFTASSGVFLWNGNSWVNLTSTEMRYWTKDIEIDPNDKSGKTLYACVWSGWGGQANGLGGLYQSRNFGVTWTRIVNEDRLSSISFDPRDTKQCYATTETNGLLKCDDITASSPIFSTVSSYNFRQPERVCFNTRRPEEMWVTSFGNGMKVGMSTVSESIPILIEPSDKSVNISSPVSFSWEGIGGPPSNYEVQISPVVLFGIIEIDDTVSVLSLAGIKLRNSMTYFWRVRAIRAGVAGSWSSTFTFSTTADPFVSSISLLLPTDKSTIQLPPGNTQMVDFSWKSSVPSSVSKYHFQLVQGTNVIEDSTLLQPSKGETIPGIPNSYQWRVRAMKNGVWESWTSMWTLNVETITDVVEDKVWGLDCNVEIIGDELFLVTNYHNVRGDCFSLLGEKLGSIASTLNQQTSIDIKEFPQVFFFRIQRGIHTDVRTFYR